MKKLVLIVIVLLMAVNCWGQIPSWEWARKGGGEAVMPSKVATDAANNVYMGGGFQHICIFGSTTYTAINERCFLVKYNTSGVLQWSKSNLGPGWNDAISGVATDTHGNVYAGGGFDLTQIIFDGISLINSSTHSPFLVKYDSVGNILWARTSIGGASVTAVATDDSDNVYITGSSSITPTLIFGNDTISNVGMSNYFIVKYNSSGSVIWAKAGDYMGTAANEVIDLKVDNYGNIYLTGTYTTNTNIPLVFGTDSLLTNGGNDIFVAKYDSSGNLIWGKGFGGVQNEFSNSIAINNFGKVFITGWFKSPTLLLDTVTLTNSYSPNTCVTFLAELNSDGNVIWARASSGVLWVGGGEQGYSVASDINGNAYITVGNLQGLIGTLTFSSLSIPIPYPSNHPLVIACIDSSGTGIWAKVLTDGGGYTPIEVANNGDIFIGSSFGDDNLVIGADTLFFNANDVYPFVAKLSIQVGQGINETSNACGITISPNPFTSQTTITFNEEFFKGRTGNQHTIKIMDVMGKEIKNYELGIRNGKTVTIDMTGYAKGIYFLRIEDEKKNVVNRKLMVQ